MFLATKYQILKKFCSKLNAAHLVAIYLKAGTIDHLSSLSIENGQKTIIDHRGSKIDNLLKICVVDIKDIHANKHFNLAKIHRRSALVKPPYLFCQMCCRSQTGLPFGGHNAVSILGRAIAQFTHFCQKSRIKCSSMRAIRSHVILNIIRLSAISACKQCGAPSSIFYSPFQYAPSTGACDLSFGSHTM